MAYVGHHAPSGLEQYYTRSASGPYPKPHASAPPPLLSAAARVRQQTLGPVFSDEEDGDDTEYIAMRMKEMAMSQSYGRDTQQSAAAAQMYQLQLQQQALAVQQQYLLQQLLSSQQQQPNRSQPGSRDTATANAIRQQQMHQMQQLQLQAQMRQQQQVDPRIQAQLLSQLQASARSPAQQQAELRAQSLAAQAELRAQASAAQAQLQARAQALARAQAQTQETKEVNERELKAKFESQPNTGHQLSRLSSRPPPKSAPDKPTTPPSSTSPTLAAEESPSKPPAPLGRFAQARQTASSPFGELTALLARRSAGTATPPKAAPSTTLPTTQTPTIAPTDDRLAARQGLQSIGLGRPSATVAQNRAKSNPFPTSPNVATQAPAVRAVSMAQPLKPIRQPFGPPAPTNELGERNFQANVRKQAGKGLGMLGRRAEQGSGASSPVVA